MKQHPLRTSVIGSYPFPGWLEFSCRHLDQFGDSDRAEVQDDAVIVALHDQLAAGLDVITDGEQTRLDLNLSFYGYLAGIELEGAPPRRFVDMFNRAVDSITGKARVCTHLCFGNYKARSVGPRRLSPMFPAFLDFHCDEMHVEMASREFCEIEVITAIAQRMDVAVGVV